MPMVEGVGDEVIQVLGLGLIVFIIVAAWKSTAIREIPQIRAVFIVDRRTHRRIPNEVSNVNNLANPPDPGPETNTTETETTPAATSNTSQTNKPTCSGQNNEINAFRLSYFTNLQNQNQPSTSAANVTQETNATENMDNTTRRETEESQNPIRVKLKYLNDEQKTVTGDLKELLGSFKRRYFQVELSHNKTVLLIFQGKVLKEDESLETIGMYDNCVVHCLIKAGRPPSERSDNVQSNTTLNSNNTQPADWNLGPVLLATLVAIFSLAWFSYWTYPQLFGITSTVLLATLTTLFVFVVASLYYPNLFQSLV